MKIRPTLILVGLGCSLMAWSAAAQDASPIPQQKVQQLWKHDCAFCHGIDGRAKTRAGRRMHVKDFTDAKYQKSFTDEKAFKSIHDGMKENGRVLMKPFAKKLKDAEIKALIQHIRKFKK